jgi:hypothetical protein
VRGVQDERKKAIANSSSSGGGGSHLQVVDEGRQAKGLVDLRDEHQHCVLLLLLLLLAAVV